MQVYKLYFKLLKSILPAVVIFGAFFAITTFLYSSNQNKNVTDYEDTKINIAVVNYDEDNPLTQSFLDYLNKYCIFHYYYNEDKLTDALNFNEVVYILTIPEKFGENFMSGKATVVEKNSIEDGIYSFIVDHAINKYFNTAKAYLNVNQNISTAKLIEGVRQDLRSDTEVNIDVIGERVRNNIFYNMYYNISSYIMLSCCLLGVGVILISTRNIDIQRRNRIAPISLRNLNLQLIGGNILFVLGFDVLFILFGVLLNNERDININILLFWLNCIIFSISSLGVSYIAALSIKRKSMNIAISIFLPLFLCFIGGAFIPQNLLNGTILEFASFTPVFWFVKGNNAIAGLYSLHSENMRDIIICMTIQIGFAAALFSLTLLLGKIKTQKNYI